MQNLSRIEHCLDVLVAAVVWSAAQVTFFEA
jgi:hypothetical protein